MTKRQKPNAASTAMRYDDFGTPMCRQCGHAVPPARDTFCSALCVYRWRCETDAAFFRSEVLRLHGRKCAVCGVVPPKRMQSPTLPQERPPGPFRIERPVEPEVPEVKFFADHRVPLWAGGTNNPKANGQVLCGPHHQAKTAQEARERAQMKRERDCATILEVLQDFPLFGEATIGQLQRYVKLGEGRVRACLKELKARGVVVQHKRGGPWVVLPAAVQAEVEAIHDAALTFLAGDEAPPAQAGDT